MLFNFALEYAIRRVVKPGWLEIKCYIPALVYDKVNILGESVHTIKENAKALIVASKKIGLSKC